MAKGQHNNRLRGAAHPKWKGGKSRLTKPCYRCKEVKPISEFWKDRHSHDGWLSACKPCSAKDTQAFLAKHPGYVARKIHAQALKRIGLTLDDYDRLSQEQQGLCAICHMPEQGHKNSKLSADHCHVSGMFRALLCNRCNRAIGLMRDDPELLEAAANYLRGHAFRKVG